MKTLFILIMTLTSFISLENKQEVETITATYDNFEDGSYFFTDKDDNFYEFQKVEEEANKKYDLTDTKYYGKTFTLSYKIVTQIDEEGEEYSIFSIQDLKLVE
jgi:hypothetical protein